jgi:acyl carrier protein
MATTDQTLDELLTMAAAHFKVPRETLTPDADFYETLKKQGKVIDSLQKLDLVTRLESHFHVELPDYEVQGVSDFRTLAERIQARL